MHVSWAVLVMQASERLVYRGTHEVRFVCRVYMQI